MKRLASSDFLIIGGGILGLSTAWQLLSRQPGAKVVVIEKEAAVGRHQTGRNSGVIHSGIYYQPGSLKATLCKRGAAATYEFCEEYAIPTERCGKLIVATNPLEDERLRDLQGLSIKNGIDADLLSAAELRTLEPNVSGVSALLVHSTGITDYGMICERLSKMISERGGSVLLGEEVQALHETEADVKVTLKGGAKISAKYLIACAGLQADRVAAMMRLPLDFQIIPYRGEYFRLPTTVSDRVQRLIYPVPDPTLPFLGIHLTRMIDGSVTVGPNAIQGWKREGYGRLNLSLADTAAMLTFPGFWRVIVKNIRPGLFELRNSIFKRAYLSEVRKYMPSISLNDLQPYPSGVRAQAVTRSGELLSDFLFAQSARSLHVCNAPSPAATSAFPIGESIVDIIVDASAGQL